MSKRSRRRQQRRPPAGLPTPDRAASPPPSTPEPEHVLLDQIAAGELDAHLVAIAEAVRARHELLHTINSERHSRCWPSATAYGSITTPPRYLQGVHDTVVGVDPHAAVVCVHRQIGRFKSGEIRCPPLVLDRLNPAA